MDIRKESSIHHCYRQSVILLLVFMSKKVYLKNRDYTNET